MKRPAGAFACAANYVTIGEAAPPHRRVNRGNTSKRYNSVRDRERIEARGALRVPAILLMVCVLPWFAGAADNGVEFPSIGPGREIESSVDVSSSGSGFRTFTFEIPEDAFAVRISIDDAPADLDLFLQHGREIQSYEYVDSMSASEDYNESLFVSRLSDPPLQNGTYYVDVVYQRASVPFHNWKRMKERKAS